MRKILGLLLVMLAASCFGANPTFSSFNPNQFSSDGSRVWIVSGAQITNFNISGYVLLTNDAIGSNFFMALKQGTSSPQPNGAFFFGESIPSGNPNFLDTLQIWCPYNRDNNYADISFGNGNFNLGPTDFHQVAVMGISSQHGNWANPYTNQSQWGVFSGDWDNGVCFVHEMTGNGTNLWPWIVAGNFSGNAIAPSLFLSKGHSHFFVTDQLTGATNYFDFNKTNASLTVPYGPVIAYGVSTTNGGIFSGNGAGLTNLPESPIYFRVSSPAVSAAYAMGTAQPGEGLFCEYSFDGVNWWSIYGDGRIQYTNSIGLHDPKGLHYDANGYWYITHTLQSQNLVTKATNIGILKTLDFLNFSPVGTGAIPFNTNTGTSATTWAPGWLSLATNQMIYATVTSNGASAFNGMIYGITSSNADYTLWTTNTKAVLLASNESANVGTGPFGTGTGLNDPFMMNILTNTWMVNSAGASNLIPSGTTVLFTYNWSTGNYDSYTNTTAGMPQQMHLCLTNVTGFPNGSEGGAVLQNQDGNYWFYGSVGFTSNSLGGGRFYVSKNTNGTLGPWTTQTLCVEIPRASFGQSCPVLLTGTNKAKLLAAIGNASLASLNYNPWKGSTLLCSVFQMPGYYGPCMMVQRSSDSATTNIGFNALGWIDTNALLTFCGVNSGTARVFYDQSGAGNHLIQTTNANQFQIVASGVLNTNALGWPTLKATASACSMRTINAVYTASGHSVFGYWGYNWNTQAYIGGLESADYISNFKGLGMTLSSSTGGSWTSGSILFNSGGFTAKANLFTYTYALPNSGFLNSTNNGTFYVIDANVGTTNSGVWINGVQSDTDTANSASYETYTNLFIGKAPSGDLATGEQVSEISFFPYSLLPAQQTLIRQSMLTRFGTAPGTPP